MTQSRRKFLTIAGLAGGATLLSGAALAQAACYAPEALPFSQKSRRRSLGYVDASDDAKRHCGLCAFFKADAAAGCGTCGLLNGPVNAGGLCTSFAAKAG